MDRPDKLRRLDGFRRRVPHVSASALASILHEIEDDRPEVYDRKSIRDARDQRVTEPTPYGPILSTVPIECDNGSFVDMVIANPFANLYIAAKRGIGFVRLLLFTLLTHPCCFDNPWDIVLYSD